MLIPPNSTIKLIAIEYEITDDPYTQPDYIGTFSENWQKNAIRTKDARFRLKEYRTNQPEGTYKIVVKRIPINF